MHSLKQNVFRIFLTFFYLLICKIPACQPAGFVAALDFRFLFVYNESIRIRFLWKSFQKIPCPALFACPPRSFFISRSPSYPKSKKVGLGQPSDPEGSKQGAQTKPAGQHKNKIKYMGKNLTKRQRQILDYVTDFMNENGYAPSIREIGEHFDLSSPATIHVHLENLKRKGFLKSGYNEARSIELVETGTNWAQALELPLVGLITAGEPIEAIEERETIAVPSDFVTDQANSYVLRVKGESMIEEGILDGDYVIVERNPSPRNGDVVVALLNNAYATLKKFYRESTRIRLQPANHTMKPIYAKDPLIQGIVRGVIRRFA
jgi:repressor LexA